LPHYNININPALINIIGIEMPVKRKNRGRAKGQKGSEPMVQCDNCGAYVPRSKIQRVTRKGLPSQGRLGART
jgi:hypothetical protein